ncbi:MULTISPECIES: diguanylate cyclase domain-containing protein [unclassified Shewanella]|uniref:bifunctional diguanylate cyclase/phosphodiesterase n=1 Tax=unclassified Shewanella TaxID=196818 RepID=UPI001BBAEE9E|nr:MULTISPECIES: diguanylate cyclase [unclassified Shewanella]GIU19522.1 bifunctional diguanylate cyclase/phosphodiesterase [Shewanella sp. MBTL60-112-B1]GIU34583.1 bifunctional diguanylate cyclase/phosphodiesterase [Shewanella sp. MBTL60-112-B2]
MFREQTSQSKMTLRLNKRITRLKKLAQKYKHAEITQNALLEISNFAAQVTTPEEFYSSLHSSIKRLIPADNFFIATLNSATGKIEVPFFQDEKDAHPKEFYPDEDLSDTLYSGLTGYVLKTDQTLICDDETYQQLVESKAITPRGSHFRQWVGTPIRSVNSTIGVLVFQSYSRDVLYDEIEIELMNFISHHISGVIQRLQNQEQLEQAISARTKELSIAYNKLKQEVYERRRAERLQQSLFEIADLANSNIDTQEFYSEIHRVISHLLPVNNCFISQLNEQRDALTFPYFVSQFDLPLPKPRPLSDGLTEYILLHSKPRLLNRDDINELIESGVLYCEAPELNETQEINQWIGVPLFIHGQVCGALTVYSYSFSQNYQEKDLELLTFVSHHIATAIEKKLSAESLKQSYEQLEDKVNKRTKALESVNQDLEKEINQRKRIERQLVHDAKHDNLTGLPNRSMFMERLTQAIKHVRRHSLDRFAVLFIDMDRFKLLNDTLGHLEGDRFLIETAKRLQQCIRSNDMLARLGGDEFVILLDSINGQQDAEDVADRVLTELSRPYELANQQFNSSASIGLAMSGQSHSDTSESILRDADTAMYQAKSQGKGCYVIFNHGVNQQQIKDIKLENELKKALLNTELQLSYLPIMTLGSEKTLAFEPRLFWHHPTLGKLKQAQLSNIAEHCNMVIELDNYLLDLVNQSYQHMQQEYGCQFQLHMSISSQHLNHKYALRALKNRIKQCQFNINELTLFFNEKAFVQNTNNHISAFDSLNKLDVKLGIEAYGSAHSAISSLTFLPIQALKLDSSYAAHLESKQHVKLVRAYFNAAQALELEVFAVGICNHKQCTILQELGFTKGQGSLLGDVIELEAKKNRVCA